MLRRRHPWLSLIRLPNLLTVPGDVLVGFVIIMPLHAGGLPELICAVMAACLFYAAGLIMNDLVDAEKDRTERPDRPIASGEVSRTSARNVTAALLACALMVCGIAGLSVLLVGAALGGLVFVYNMYARANRFLGSLVMGMCRAGSIALGAAAALPSEWPGWEIFFVLGWWVAVVGSITWLASKEVMRRPFGTIRWLPLIVMVCGGLIVLMLSEQQNPQSLFRSVFGIAFAVLLAYQSGIRLGVPLRVKAKNGRVLEYDPTSIYPPAIGVLISALMPMQAAMLILFSDEPWVLLSALLLLIGWPVNRWLAKKFAPS